ncbi:MAG: hypothetical protein LBJ08_02760 [Bifidobacteriaceae bacterium]|jgi:UDP-N-acetylglucosamine acyltransferase|nr:hypothetical protein [Bifidobacteriaceae bacterium]
MNNIHPTAVIGHDVVLGESNFVGPGAVLTGPLRIGSNNWIGAGVMIGGPPEIRDYPHRSDWLEAPSGFGIEIGDGNVIREMTVIHQGSHRFTKVGSGCYIMSKSYIAHDVELCDNVTVSAETAFAGHVRVGEGTTVGVATVVHQFRVIGAGVMLGMGSIVTKDIPPFAKAFGNPARIRGANTVGMGRSGIGAETIETVDTVYREWSGEPPHPEQMGELAGHVEWWREAIAAQ